MNDGEENWKEYPEMLKFLQNLCPEKSGQLMELFITHEAFILDVLEKRIDVLTVDGEEYEKKLKELMQSFRNPATAHTDFLKQQNEKIPFETKIYNAGESILDAIYLRGRDK